jgi:hypothetical protein
MAASGSLNTPVLGLTRAEVTLNPFNSYQAQVDLETQINDWRTKFDTVVGMLTASCYCDFVASSSFDGIAGGSDVYAEHNPGPNRIIQEVVCYAGQSGSGGVTTVDCQVQGTPGSTTFTSIFGPLGGPANAAMRVALSASAGNYGLAKSGQTLMTSGSNTIWPAGSLLKILFTTAAGAVGGSAMKNIVTYVRWSPSGSWPGNTAPA